MGTVYAVQPAQTLYVTIRRDELRQLKDERDQLKLELAQLRLQLNENAAPTLTAVQRTPLT
ncbi:DUF6026 family protein [Pseudomonas vancouverensis]|uniref:Uncharacterized protein n=1 Tax=Pseudomonas vancouverensis TaxID=95300 RepID=A0A1H2NDS8_PSEVA|nr:DUF6026 family protein [Pseudomonas vancouverensis]KAB0494199.1 hypothetical protein F7R09_20730 [Pseudomonas vancouverensis]TDB60507.1 hypothetical protein EIY72_16830 [Pseudomonas vancouverensis]SDV03331.1 hypothetical protein SAMN05216558_2063 [Pseudomonas vancouverensis]